MLARMLSGDNVYTQPSRKVTIGRELLPFLVETLE